MLVAARAAADEPLVLGTAARLAALVDRYASAPHHRTGTGPERRTTRWFARELARRGAAVVFHPFAFERSRTRAMVRLGGVPVECFPLPYAWTGRVVTTRPAVGTMLLQGSLEPIDLAEAVAGARADRAPALVLATRSTLPVGGRLVVPNRAPVTTGDLPVVLVRGSYASALRQRAVEVRASASPVAGHAANVVGVFGRSDPRPIVIATPLSGWFRCAAERGSGVAIALELAAALARTHPVVVVGTTGHELDFLGLRRLLATTSWTPRLVLHLGASLAAMQGDGAGGRSLAPLRIFAHDLDDAAHAALTSALAPAGFLPLRHGFVGEGVLWRELGAPVLSFSGTFPLFHTPDDIVARTIDPAALAIVHEAVAHATDAALRAVG